MTRHRTFVEINISSIPVNGLGGLGLLSMAAVVAATLPELRAPVLWGIGGGLAIAVALIAFNRRQNADRPSGRYPSILFRTASDDVRERSGRRDSASARGAIPRRRVPALLGAASNPS